MPLWAYSAGIVQFSYSAERLRNRWHHADKLDEPYSGQSLADLGLVCDENLVACETPVL